MCSTWVVSYGKGHEDPTQGNCCLGDMVQTRSISPKVRLNAKLFFQFTSLKAAKRKKLSSHVCSGNQLGEAAQSRSENILRTAMQVLNIRGGKFNRAAI